MLKHYNGLDFDCWFYVSLAEKLPYSIRILLESAIRNCDEFAVKAKDVEKIIDWENTSPKLVEIPFKPARVLLQVSILLLKIGWDLCCHLMCEKFVHLGFYWCACCC